MFQLNGKILECWANEKSQNVTTLINKYCDREYSLFERDSEFLYSNEQCPQRDSAGNIPCCFLFANTSLTDRQIGFILLISSLALIIICLVVLVKTLNSVLRGKFYFIKFIKFINENRMNKECILHNAKLLARNSENITQYGL